jgi:hypothetical protein
VASYSGLGAIPLSNIGLMGGEYGPLGRRHSGKGRAVRSPVDPFRFGDEVNFCRCRFQGIAGNALGWFECGMAKFTDATFGDRVNFSGVTFGSGRSNALRSIERRVGDARYRELSARFLAIASTMGADLSEADIRRTTEIVRRLSDETKGLSEQLPRSMKLVASAKGEQ